MWNLFVGSWIMFVVGVAGGVVVAAIEFVGKESLKMIGGAYFGVKVVQFVAVVVVVVVVVLWGGKFACFGVAIGAGTLG